MNLPKESCHQELYEEIAKELGIQVEEVIQIHKIYCKQVIRGLKEGWTIKLPNLGKFIADKERHLLMNAYEPLPKEQKLLFLYYYRYYRKNYYGNYNQIPLAIKAGLAASTEHYNLKGEARADL